MRDSFGVDVAPGDYILSAPSNKWGRPKIGTVYAALSGRLMVDVAHGPSSERSKVEVGSDCAVLRKANGDVPAHIGGEGHRLVINGASHAVDEMELQEIEEDAFGYLVWVPRDHEKESA